jgi:hypothetical protein
MVAGACLDDALAAAADETAVDETEAGEAGTADAAGGRDGAIGARGSGAQGRARARTTAWRVPTTR